MNHLAAAELNRIESALKDVLFFKQSPQGKPLRDFHELTTLLRYHENEKIPPIRAYCQRKLSDASQKEYDELHEEVCNWLHQTKIEYDQFFDIISKRVNRS